MSPHLSFQMRTWPGPHLDCCLSEPGQQIQLGCAQTPGHRNREVLSLCHSELPCGVICYAALPACLLMFLLCTCLTVQAAQAGDLCPWARLCLQGLRAQHIGVPCPGDGTLTQTFCKCLTRERQSERYFDPQNTECFCSAGKVEASHMTSFLCNLTEEHFLSSIRNRVGWLEGGLVAAPAGP